MTKRIISSDFKTAISWYVIAIFFTYFMPSFLAFLFYISLLAIITFSKKTHVFIGLFLIMYYSPGFLFSPLTSLSVPKYSFGPLGRDFTFYELLIFILFVKAAFVSLSKSKNDLISVGSLFRTWVFIAILMLIISVFYEDRLLTILKSIKFLLPFSLLFSILTFVDTRKKLLSLFEIILPFTYFILFTQILLFTTGRHLFQLLGGEFVAEHLLVYNDYDFTAGDGGSRPLYSTQLVLFLIPMAFFYQQIVREDPASAKTINKPEIISAISFIILALSATRGYILASIVSVVLVLIVNRNIKTFRRIMVASIIIVLFFSFIPFFNTQLNFAFNRLSTLNALLQGDVSAGGTLSRITNRLPIVLDKFNESPIIGFGFTDEYYKFDDGHVAFASILLNSGIMGFSILYYIIFKYLFNSIRYGLKGKKVFIYIALTFISFIILHSTTFMVFSYAIGQGNYLMFIFLIAVYRIEISTNNLK